MDKIQIPRAVYKYVEHLLFQYPEAKKELNRLREEILFSRKRDDENIGGGRSNLPGDPVGRAVVELYNHRKVREIEENVNLVEEIVNQLPEEKRKMVTLYYWSRPRRFTWSGIAMEIGREESTLRRWRREIVSMIAIRKGLA